MFLKIKIVIFGRNLDYEFSYGEQIVVTPRNFEYGLDIQMNHLTNMPSLEWLMSAMDIHYIMMQ